MLYLFHLKVWEEIHVVWVKYREWETSEEEVSNRNKIPVLRITCWYRDSNWSNEVINFYLSLVSMLYGFVFLYIFVQYLTISGYFCKPVHS